MLLLEKGMMFEIIPEAVFLGKAPIDTSSLFMVNSVDIEGGMIVGSIRYDPDSKVLERSLKIPISLWDTVVIRPIFH